MKRLYLLLVLLMCSNTAFSADKLDLSVSGGKWVLLYQDNSGSSYLDTQRIVYDNGAVAGCWLRSKSAVGGIDLTHMEITNVGLYRIIDVLSYDKDGNYLGEKTTSNSEWQKTNLESSIQR